MSQEEFAIVPVSGWVGGWVGVGVGGGRQQASEADRPRSLSSNMTGRRGVVGCGWCLRTLLQEDDSSVSRALIKQSVLTISGPQPTQASVLLR